MNLKPLKLVLSMALIGSVVIGSFALVNTQVDAQAAGNKTTGGESVVPAAPVIQGRVSLPDFAELVERNGAAVVNISVETRGKNDPRALGAEDDEDNPEEEFLRKFFQFPRPDRNDPRIPRSEPKGEPKGEPKAEDKWGEGAPSAPNPRATPRSQRERAQQEREPLRQTQEGSGFIMSGDGYILTNAHVIDGAEVIYVTLTDKRQFRAKVIGTDRRTDIAVLKVEAAGLPAVRVGDPSKVRPGEWVLAIGSPFGFDNSVTAGIVSAKARDTRAGGGPRDNFGDLVSFIQTDVAVNPGNSGGPLFNTRGEVIGINSQIFSRTGAYAGISFSIPIDVAINIYDQIRTTGKVVRGRIGVQIGNVSRTAAEGLGLRAGQGASVNGVMPDAPAAAAGVKVGDVILKVNGKPVESSSDVSRLVGDTKPGSKIAVTILREGKERDLPITVAELKEEPPVAAKAAPGKEKPKAKVSAKDERIGVVVADISSELKKKADVTNGVVVEDVAGGARTGLEAGDIIVQFNGQPVSDAKQFRELAAKVDLKKGIALLVKSPRARDALQLRSFRVDE